MCLNPVFVRKVGSYVSCGKCIECKMKKSEMWAFRVALEASLYDNNCMITLTYNEDNLPAGQTLSLTDYQKFVKRLRKSIAPKKIRFFGCGEYGERNARPHYHIIVFGWKPADLVKFCIDKKKQQLFRSTHIEKLWTKGFSTVGEVTFDTAKYCALYLQKPPKDGLLRPFVTMSKNNGGIGFNAFNHKWLYSDKLYVNGKSCSIPRYFLDKLEKDFAYDLSSFKQKRIDRCLANNYEVYSPEWQEWKRRIKANIKKYEKIFKKSLDTDFMI